MALRTANPCCCLYRERNRACCLMALLFFPIYLGCLLGYLLAFPTSSPWKLNLRRQVKSPTIYASLRLLGSHLKPSGSFQNQFRRQSLEEIQRSGQPVLYICWDARGSPSLMTFTWLQQSHHPFSDQTTFFPLGRKWVCWQPWSPGSQQRKGQSCCNNC